MQEFEYKMVGFVFEQYLGQKWRGQDLPKDLYRSVVANVRAISDMFTSERGSFKTGYLRSPEGRSAYILYFHLANVCRTLAVFEEMKKRGLWPRKPIRILDIGSASAPSLWALALFTEKHGGEIAHVEAWDQEKGILKDAAGLWETIIRKEIKNLPAMQTRRTDAFTPRIFQNIREKFDLVICSNMLNEFPKFEPVVNLGGQILKNALAENGHWIVLEPALMKLSRRLMELRDALIQKTNCSVPIPCGHPGPCPLNFEPKDWCHFEQRWNVPPLRQRLEKSLDHRSGTLKYSYLVVSPEPQTARQNTFRVLSDPLTGPAGDLILLCVPEKKVALHFSRNKDETGKFMNKLWRGDLLRIDNFDDLEERNSPHRYSRALFLRPNTRVNRA